MRDFLSSLILTREKKLPIEAIATGRQKKTSKLSLNGEFHRQS